MTGVPMLRARHLQLPSARVAGVLREGCEVWGLGLWLWAPIGVSNPRLALNAFDKELELPPAWCAAAQGALEQHRARRRGGRLPRHKGRRWVRCGGRQRARRGGQP